MRFGLIGCGWIAERDHVPAMLQCPKVEIVGTADISLDRARLVGRLAGISEGQCYSDYRQLLEREDVEVVSLAAPPSTHLQVISDAAGAGKHIVCEKPFALSLADADTMIETCERAGVVLASYHNYLYYFEHRLATSVIEEGTIGEVVATEISGLGSRTWRGTDGFRPGWRFEPEFAGGGVVMDIGVHAFYLTELFLPQPIDAVFATMRFLGTGADDYSYCHLCAGGETTGMVNLAWGQGTAHFEIDGTAGCITYVYDEGAGYFGAPVRAVRIASAGKPTVVHVVPPGRTQFSPLVFGDLVDAISGERAAYPAFGADARRTIEIAHAAYESNARRRLVTLPLVAGSDIYQRGALPLLLEHRTEGSTASPLNRIAR
jgi:predicted dehydrogenase